MYTYGHNLQSSGVKTPHFPPSLSLLPCYDSSSTICGMREGGQELLPRKCVPLKASLHYLTEIIIYDNIIHLNNGLGMF